MSSHITLRFFPLSLQILSGIGDWQHQSVKGAACVVFVVLEILRSFLQGFYGFHMCVADIHSCVRERLVSLFGSSFSYYVFVTDGDEPAKAPEAKKKKSFMC